MKKINAFLIIIFSFFIFPGIIFPLTFNMRITRITDGDTMTASYYGLPITIRLADIDTPEIKQDFGKAAKAWANFMALGKDAQFKLVNKDRYGRYIGVLTIDGVNINKYFVQNGYAWWYDAYSDDISYKKLQEEAKRKKLGLWRYSNRIPPWEYRSRKRNFKRKRKFRRNKLN